MEGTVINVDIANAVFRSWYGTNWPTHRCCIITNIDLSQNTKSAKFKFPGSPEDRAGIKTVWFKCVGRVDHIPIEIFDDFPLLDGLIISESHLPIVRNDLFRNLKFRNLKYLDLTNNEIEDIEQDAFIRMESLKLVSLQSNKLKALNYNYFEHNPELETFICGNNMITDINPTIFYKLKKLKYFQILRPNTFNRYYSIKSETPLIETAILNEFSEYFSNYIKRLNMENENLKKNLESLKRQQYTINPQLENFGTNTETCAQSDNVQVIVRIPKSNGVSSARDPISNNN